MIRVVFYNLIFLLIGIVIIELIFGGWLRESNKINHLNLIKDRRFTREVDLYTEGKIKIVYSRDIYGLRGSASHDHPEKIDILTIGGSTTDQRFLTDGETWQDALERCLNHHGHRVAVSNAGIDGQSTFGHIKNFELWFPHIPGLKPSYILFYIGINDLFSLASNRQFDELNPPKNLTQRIKQVLSSNSVIYNKSRMLFGWMLAHNMGLGHTKTDFNALQYTESGISGRALYDLQRTYLGQFEDRVRKLIEYSKKMGSTPIFVTQPSILYKFDSSGRIMGISEVQGPLGIAGKIVDSAMYNGVDYYRLITQMNESIRKVCDNRYPVIDLTSRPIWKFEDFYDYIHNTPKGAEKIGHEICLTIKDFPKLK